MGGSKTNLVIINGNLKAQGYVDNVLRPVVPFLEQHPVCLMHDNTRPHTARTTQAFLPDMTLTSCHGLFILRTCIRLSICGICLDGNQKQNNISPTTSMTSLAVLVHE